MKKQQHPFVKLAGCKNEAELYSRYPTAEHFFGQHPEARMVISKGHMEQGGSLQGPIMVAGTTTPVNPFTEQQYFPHNFNAQAPITHGHMQMGGNWMNPNMQEPVYQGHMQTGGFIMPAMNPVDMPTMYTEHMATGGKKKTSGMYDIHSGAYFQYGGIADDDRDIDMMKKGGIHIKPENKGKFNATKKATGKTTEELTHSSNPVTRKRAVFAQNAAKWHHETGGVANPFHPLHQFMQEGGGFQLPGKSPFETDNQTNTTDTMSDVYSAPAQAVNPDPYADERAQKYNNNIPGVTPDTIAPSPQQVDQQQAQVPAPQQRYKWAQPAANLLGAGLMTASFFEDKRNQRNAQGYQRQLGMTSNMPQVVNVGSHGNFSQTGSFRPGQGVPSQSPMYNTMEQGGQYQRGGTYEMDEKTINELIRKGYKIERV